MRREVPVEDLQKLYTANDMAKTDCRGCVGCSDCCSGMGESVILDPFDCFELEKGLQTDFSGLLEQGIELNVSEELILPNLSMKGEKEECSFLDVQGRCRIHSFRPGICRMFPLGRYYEGERFFYFLQSHECPMEQKSKTKISKWLGIPRLKEYEAYIMKWHFLLEDARETIEKGKEDSHLQRELATYLLQQFYQQPYNLQEDFYPQFEVRYQQMKKLLVILNR